MTEQIAIVVNGVSGRMGRMLVQVIAASDKARLSGAIERPGHDWVGRDLGEMLGGAANGVIVSDSAQAALQGAQAVIDFTAPAATLALAEVAVGLDVVHVIGTTGFAPEDLAVIARLAQKGVIVRAGNMSLGVNLLTALTRKVAAALDTEYDIEIVTATRSMRHPAPR